MTQRILTVVAANPAWPQMFKQEAQRITGVLTASNLHAVQHIGSTSVPGLAAKPIIDIQLQVHDLKQLDDESGAMQGLGYEVKGEFGIPGRRYFRKSSQHQRTHHVHAFEAGSSAAIRHLAFRDYLKAHPSIAEDYAKLKLQAAKLCNNDMDFYCDYKNEFVQHHEALALNWYQSGVSSKG